MPFSLRYGYSDAMHVYFTFTATGVARPSNCVAVSTCVHAVQVSASLSKLSFGVDF